MLLNLSVRDILIVRALELDLGPGLTVLTGETGSGKSILLDCLGLALGWRGRAATHGAWCAVHRVQCAAARGCIGPCRPCPAG